MSNVLVLDNRDSFVFNLVDEFCTRGIAVTTLRSDLSLAELESVLGELRPELVVLSPGPGRPEEGGVMVEWLATRPQTPVLGICLGHQALAVASGGAVSRAPTAVHGRADRLDLVETEPLFDGLARPFVAARYHSLVVTRVPDTMQVIASAAYQRETLVMGLRHRSLCQVGLQFHPESILTPWGRVLLWRFYDEACRYNRTGRDGQLGEEA